MDKLKIPPNKLRLPPAHHRETRGQLNIHSVVDVFDMRGGDVADDVTIVKVLGLLVQSQRELLYTMNTMEEEYPKRE